MDTTDNFDKFSTEVKKCQTKIAIEECSNEKLIKGAVNKCGCLMENVNRLQQELKVINEFMFG